MAQEPANQLYKLKVNSQLSTSSHKSISTMAPLLSTGKAEHYFQHMATTKPYTSNGPIAIDQESKAWLPAHGIHEKLHTSNGPFAHRNGDSKNFTHDHLRRSLRIHQTADSRMPMYCTQAPSGSNF
jgi:hypothetical protein